jgi:hypothetical protein
MTFEEIMNKDGDYVADGFAEGFCLKVNDSALYGKQYSDRDDLFPTCTAFQMFKSLLYKDYKPVLTRQS